MPAASEPWWTSRAARAMRRWMSALQIVEKLEHRAGKDAEGKTGDGVGILTPDLPHSFFRRRPPECGIHAGGGAGLWRRHVFLSRRTTLSAQPGQEDVRDHCGQGRHGISGLAEGAYLTQRCWARRPCAMHAQHLAGLCGSGPAGRPGDWTLTAGCMWPAGSLSSPTPTPTCRLPVQPDRGL